MQKNSSDNEKEVLVDPLHLEVSGKSNSVFDDPEWQKVFGVDHNMFLPVKTKCRPKNTTSNWHWRKYLSDHMPLQDWELEDLNMSDEEAIEEIVKWDR